MRASSGFLRQPYLQRLQGETASVLWTASRPGVGSVMVIAPDGTSTAFSAAATAFQPSATELSFAYYQYQVDITGLRPGTTYKYHVVLDGQVLASDPVQNSFRTPTSGNFSFLVLGDSGLNTPEQAALIQQMMAEPNISKVIHVGDLAYETGTFTEFENNYFAMYAPLMGRVPFFTAPGNHEYMTNSAAPYLAAHRAPACGVPSEDVGRYYAFDWGDVHFVSIDSNLLPGGTAARMLAWMDADLAASGKYWKIVFVHHPPYPTGAHLEDPICALVKENVVPVVERHGVQLVLAGHEHGYERSFPLIAGQPVDSSTPSTTYLISGGGGADLEGVGSLPQCALSISTFNYLRVDVAGSALTVTATGLNGVAIDRISLNPSPALTPGGIVNASDHSASVVAGSMVSIFGQNLATRGISAGASMWPKQLGGVSVTINGVAASVAYVSPSQVNVHVPMRALGQATFNVSTSNGSATGSVFIEKPMLQHR